VVRNLLIETQAGEPAPRQMYAQFFDQLALTADARFAAYAQTRGQS